MFSSRIIQRQIRDLAQKGIDLVADPKLTIATKKSRLDEIEAKISHLTTECEQAEFVEAKSRGLMDLGGENRLPPTGRMGAAFGRRSVVPSLDIADDEAARIFRAMKSHSTLKLELKAASDVGAMMPPTLVPGVVAFRTEPTRISSVLPSSAMSSPSVEYLRHLSTTGSAGVVAAGAEKPEVSPVIQTVTIAAVKLAAVVRANDENFEDFPGFTQFLTTAVTQSLISVENSQLLYGTGANGQIQGLLTVPGTLARAVGTDSDADAIEQAIDDLRTGAAFTTPTSIIMHPTTFSGIRRSKDAEGRYLLTQSQDLTSTGPSSLWGIGVVLTTDIAPGTAVVLDADSAVNVWVKQGITIDVSNSSGDDFVHNMTMFRVEERLALAVVRPSAIVVVSGLGIAP